LEKTRRKIESLFSQGLLTRREVENVYGLLFLKAMVTFESFIENIFLGLLTGRIIPNSSKIVPRIRFKSPAIAREVVFNGQPYVDWFPYKEKTIERAYIFFRGGIPFTLIDEKEKQILFQICCIRNALAHRSRHSLLRFEKHVLGSLTLTKKERTVEGFLRSQFRTSPDQTRYEDLINGINSIFMKLCKM
jgi:hypothetical protein